MGRYRPPPPARSNYITTEGRLRLQEELRELWEVKRPQVTRAVGEAAALGDRSENAEYIYGKKQLREIDSRVRYLRKRLEFLVVVDQVPDDRSRVFFGARVTVADETGTEQEFRIVGPDEFDRQRDYISMDAPLARALLGRKLDDRVRVQLPSGVKILDIVEIRYESG